MCSTDCQSAKQASVLIIQPILFMMKKTLFILASLALGAVSSQAAILGTVTFQRNGANAFGCAVNTDTSYGLTGSLDSIRNNYGNTPSLLNDANVPDEFFIPNASTGSGGWWYAEFTFTNNSGHDMEISSIDFTMIGATTSGLPASGDGGIANSTSFAGYNYVGGYEGNYNKPLKILASLKLSSGGVRQYFNASTAASDNPDGGDWNGTHKGTFDFASAQYVVKAGENFTVYIEAEGDSSTTGFTPVDLCMGIKEIQINGDGTPVPVVPEPATASLSLLGLTALMMRRRRA